MKLGPTLLSLCNERRLNLAKLSRITGVPRQTLHNWTLGRRSVNPEQLRVVAKALKVSTHYLLFGENDPFEGPGDEILREIFSGDVRVTLHKIERSRRK